MAPNQPSREIACYFDVAVGRYIFGESKESLVRWLRNFGLNPADREISPTWLLKLSRPWVPQEFPTLGRDIANALPSEVQRRVFVAGRATALLFEATTETGPVFASVVLEGAKERELSNGFRHISRVPLENIVGSFSARAVSRIPVSRADGAWIHGRDHNPSYTVLATRMVAIVGCGAVGAAVAKLLAQAGVGKMLLIDHDSLTTANVGRHPLGIEYAGLNKAMALSAALRKSFPHLQFDDIFPKRFERLSRPDREKLGSVDLIVCAGIDFDGESALDAWRTSLDQPPALVSTWAEAFGTAGHAVLLYGKTSIRPAFDESELPLMRLTDWPDGSGTLIVEAGCGNVFQPHGVVDLHPVIGMAASLVVDALTNRAPTSCRRYWLGDRTQVLSNGGTPLLAFNESKVVREVAW
ncbi:Dinucleotide-utilizing enzymes involved in molybdopterin and thiamine biosynthesis family 2 [Variovorax sp. HW608]|nr:Dinucleotide-utilizing enzymes involved in molybdopterin and thiamine biosynthesis family 2 [Variovorax sp. HW608]